MCGCDVMCAGPATTVVAGILSALLCHRSLVDIMCAGFGLSAALLYNIINNLLSYT